MQSPKGKKNIFFHRLLSTQTHDSNTFLLSASTLSAPVNNVVSAILLGDSRTTRLHPISFMLPLPVITCQSKHNQFKVRQVVRYSRNGASHSHDTYMHSYIGASLSPRASLPLLPRIIRYLTARRSRCTFSRRAITD